MRHHLSESIRALWTSLPQAAVLLAILVAAPLMVAVVRAQTGTLLITGGPTVDEASLTATSATVTWTTNSASTSVVDFGTTTSLGQTYRLIVPMEEVEVYGTGHSITLWELLPDTTYYFKVRSVSPDGLSVGSGQHSFKTKAAVTPPSAPEPAIEPEPEPPADTEIPEPVSAPPADTEPEEEPVAVPEPAIEPEPEPPADTEIPEPVSAPPADTEPPESATGMEAKPEEVGAGTEDATGSTAEPADTEPAPTERPSVFDSMSESINRVRAGIEGEGSAITSDIAGAEQICRENGIVPERCSYWLEARYADRSCAERGLTTKESCERYLTDQNGGTFPGCEGKGEDECRVIKSMKTIGYLSAAVKEAVDGTLRNRDGWRDVAGSEGMLAVSADVIDDAKWWPSPSEGETSGGCILLDSDHDGLPDDLEKMRGTDPYASDTDGDGTSDQDELMAGLDGAAAGPGAGLTPVELALLNKRPLQQPLAAGVVDEAFGVDIGLTALVADGPDPDPGTDVTEIPSGGGYPAGDRTIPLSGHCSPDTTCLVYIYSYVPFVLVAATDAAGNWSYSLDGGDLAEGPHAVYVAAVDQDGQVVKKSRPLSFFIREARATTAEDYLRADFNVPEEPGAQYLAYYLLGVFALVLLALAVIVFFQRQMIRRRQGDL